MSTRFNRQSILIVEDEMLIADCLAMIVEDENGSVVGPAPSIVQALRCLDGTRVTAAILDVNLRDGEVTPVVDVLRARGIPFVVHTGGVLPVRLRDAIGTAPVFHKPASYERLVSTLQGLIAEYGARKSTTAAFGHALIIEDDDSTALIIEAFLSQLGYGTIDRAATETGAIAAAQHTKPELMIVDIRLAEGNGMSAAATIQARLGAIPALFMTAYPELIVGMDADRVLRKPITTEAIKVAIAMTRS